MKPIGDNPVLFARYVDEVLGAPDERGGRRPRRPDKTARCGGNGGRCGQSLVSVWYERSGAVLIVRAPTIERTPSERRAVYEKLGRLKAPDGLDLLAADPATIADGDSAQAWCSKHGHRTVDLSTLRDTT